jgi:hypothetical protein
MKAIKCIFAALLSITVVACGGGGGGGSSTPATPVTYSISGAVSGDITSGVTITLSGAASASTTTATGGTYSFAGLADGSYIATPSLTGYTFNPASASITVSGAGVTTGANFTAIANSSALATVSGTITGPWVEGVTITMSGAASGTATTDASGNYSFANVASGASYTFTPSLTGYTYSNTSETVAIPGGNTAPVTVPSMAASSAIASSSVSGTISYVGSLTGGIRLRVHDGNCTSYCQNYASIYLPDQGGSFASVPYTIRGLRPTGGPGTPTQYAVQAFIANVPSHAINASDPRGKSAAFSTTAGTDVTGQDIAITDQSPAAFTTMDAPNVAPGPGSALIQYNAPVDTSGKELATSYTLTYATDSGFTTGVVNVPFDAQGTNQSVYILNGLTDSQTYYFKMTATNGGDSVTSAATGAVTIGAPAGAATVSGAVTFTGSATGPMLVGVFSNTTGEIYYTTVTSPVSPQSYSVAGVPDGDYSNFAIIDMNDNNIIDAGDITNVNGNQVLPITVSGGTVTTGTGDITLSSASSLVRINTDHQFDGSTDSYILEMSADDGTRHVVNVTMVSGPDLSVPFDLGPQRNNNLGIYLSASPTVGADIYTFQVTYSDSSKETVTVSVDPVANFFAQNLTAVTDGTGGSSSSVPLFTWSAPASPPASYTYSLFLDGNGIRWDYPSDSNMPSSTTSVLFNDDGKASSSSLSTGAYYWQIRVTDSSGNSATYQTSYTAP